MEQTKNGAHLDALLDTMADTISTFAQVGETPEDVPPVEASDAGGTASPATSSSAVPVHARQAWERLVTELGHVPTTREFRPAVGKAHATADHWRRILIDEARAPLPPVLASEALTTAQAAHDAAVQHLAAYEQTCREAAEAVMACDRAMQDMEHARIVSDAVTVEQAKDARKALDDAKERVADHLPPLRARFDAEVHATAAALEQARSAARLERHNALVAERVALLRGEFAQVGAVYAAVIERVRALIDEQQNVDAAQELPLGEPVVLLTCAVWTAMGDVLPLPPASLSSRLHRVEDLVATDETLRTLTPTDVASAKGTGRVWVQFVGRDIPNLREAYQAAGVGMDGLFRLNETAFHQRKPIEVRRAVFAALQARYKDAVREVIPATWR